MSRQPYGPCPAERDELARMLPVPADRDLPAGRRPILKEFLMNEIEQTAGTPALPRRRRLTAIAVPVAIAAAVGAAFTLLGGSTDAKPLQAVGGGSAEKIVNANYSLEKESGGWVVVKVKIKSKLNQAKIRADFERVGIPSSGIFVARDDCKATPPWAEHRKSLSSDKILYPSGGGTGSYVWHVKPSAIPAGYYLGITMTELPANATFPGTSIPSPSGMAGFGITQGPPPACMPTRAAFHQPSSGIPGGPKLVGVAHAG